MSFDLEALRSAVAEHGSVARVVVARIKGSVPREVGASMLIWADGMSGTIGGGTLEYDAIARAREVLSSGTDRLDHQPLGPALGQCCGGAVSVLIERYDAERLATLRDGPVARALPGEAGQMPLQVSRLLSRSRGQGEQPEPGIVTGWMVEPLATRTRSLWIYGAGHVGRALVDVIAPLPDIAVTWIDTSHSRFPDDVPAGVTPLIAHNPADSTAHAPDHADHLILTYSHALDLELCHRLIARPAGSIGLIGSKTKWARFRSRLRQLGHGDAQIDRIACPIGDPALGKHPQAIALGVATRLLSDQMIKSRAKGIAS